jgi:hypothetical protein
LVDALPTLSVIFSSLSVPVYRSSAGVHSYEGQVTDASWCLQEIKSGECQMKDVQQQCDQLIQQMQDKKNQLQELQNAASELDERLEEGKLRRQKVHCPFRVLICIHLSISCLYGLVVRAPSHRSRGLGFSEK